MKKLIKPFTICALLGTALTLQAQVTTSVIVNPSQTWIGYMNWSPVAGDAAGYGGSGGGAWATADLQASFSGSVLTLSPNINTYNATDPYWVNADGSGANNMDALMYVQDDTLAGSTVTFSGTTLANTLVSPYTSAAFIRDFTPSYGSFTQSTVPLTAGSFSINLATTAGDHIQYGFETIGPDANPATVASLGNVQIAAVPEPSTLALAGLGGLAGLFLIRRRKLA